MLLGRSGPVGAGPPRAPFALHEEHSGGNTDTSYGKHANGDQLAAGEAATCY